MGMFSRLFKKKTPQSAPKAAEPEPAAKTSVPKEPEPTPRTPAPSPVQKAAASDAAPKAPARKTPEPDAGSAFKQLLTSQLAALWLDTGDEAYRNEYLRRMKICALVDDDAKKMFEYETEILRAHPRPEMLRNDFIFQPMFNLIKPVLDHPVSHYETNFEYPLSYIVKLSDEAEWHFWNSHERSYLTDEAWAEIFALSDRCRKLFLPFANDLLTRGWTVAAVNRFSYHEQGMLDKYRWGRSVTRAAKNPWQEE